MQFTLLRIKMHHRAATACQDTPSFLPASRSLCRVVLLCACLLAGAAAESGCRVDVDDMLVMERFRAWQAVHNRTYATAAERRRRFEVYCRNVEYIEATNRRGELSYELGENEFTDLTDEEFRATYTMQPRQVLTARKAMRHIIKTRAGLVRGSRNSSYTDSAASAVPNSVDWRSKDAVTPARNQMTCGSCWAFATVASIESLYKINTGRLVSLSEQELVDCDTPADHGCNGGYPGVAMWWVARNGGLATASDYPYENTQGRCRRYKIRNRMARIRGGVPVERNNEAALELAVARQPVTVLINADSLQFYKGGVFSGPCDARTNHAVTVVGYGADDGGSGGQSYWIVKNSWGASWGEKGFFRLERRVKTMGGMCGIATLPFFPVM